MDGPGRPNVNAIASADVNTDVNTNANANVVIP